MHFMWQVISCLHVHISWPPLTILVQPSSSVLAWTVREQLSFFEEKSTSTFQSYCFTSTSLKLLLEWGSVPCWTSDILNSTVLGGEASLAPLIADDNHVRETPKDTPLPRQKNGDDYYLIVNSVYDETVSLPNYSSTWLLSVKCYCSIIHIIIYLLCIHIYSVTVFDDDHIITKQQWYYW